MSSAVMINGKTEPEVSTVKRRLDNIFGSYDKFTKLVAGAGVSGTENPVIFGRNAVADFPLHQNFSQHSTRHGSESQRSTLSRHSASSSSRHQHSSTNARAGGESHRPPTMDVLQSMQDLVKDKMLTELDCSTNKNCLVKDHHSMASTSEQIEAGETQQLNRKRKHNNRREGLLEVEKILQQFCHVSPLLSPVRRPATPPTRSPLRHASRSSEKHAEPTWENGVLNNSGPGRQSDVKRLHLDSQLESSTAKALRLVTDPQPLIKPLAGMDLKIFSKTETALRQPSSKPSPSVDRQQFFQQSPTIMEPEPMERLAKPIDYSQSADYSTKARISLPAAWSTKSRLVLSSFLPYDICFKLCERCTESKKTTEVNHQKSVEEKNTGEKKKEKLYGAVLPARYKDGWPLSDKVRVIWYGNIGEFGNILPEQNNFKGMKKVVVQLPDVTEGSAESIIIVMETLVKSVKDTSFIMIPPPPQLSVDFERIVDYLLDLRVEQIDANPTFRGRNLFSLGWAGNRLNDVHSDRGCWTPEGLYCIRHFLKGALKMDWLLKKKPKKTVEK